MGLGLGKGLGVGRPASSASPVADRGRDLRIVAATGLSMSRSSASLTSFCSEVMMLPGVKPGRGVLDLVKALLEVGHFGLAHGFLELALEFGGHLRALPIHWPTMRSTPGSSFGPMAISATTAMTTSSLHPMSNMKHSAHARRVAAQSL